jgi:hypothetical protein
LVRYDDWRHEAADLYGTQIACFLQHQNPAPELKIGLRCETNLLKKIDLGAVGPDSTGLSASAQLFAEASLASAGEFDKTSRRRSAGP